MSHYRYPVDLTVRTDGEGGCAPEGHERRCQGKARSTGRQCGQWAYRDSLFCGLHGGRRSHDSKPHKSAMKKNRYAGVVGGTLADRLNELAQQSDSERLDLSSEVDVAETTLEKTLIVFDQICHQGKLDKPDPNTGEIVPNRVARDAAIQQVRNAIDFVRQMRMDAAKITLLSKEKIPANNLGFLTDQIVVAFQKVLEPHFVADPALLGRIGDEFAARIKALKILVKEGEQNGSVPTVTISIE